MPQLGKAGCLAGSAAGGKHAGWAHVMHEYAVGDEPVPGYQIIRPLGAGGYGTVWVAKSPGDVEIALKIINLQGQGLKEFRAIGLVKKLRHPNLIPIYAFWLKDEYGNFLDSTAQDSVNLRGKQSELIIAMGLGDKSLAQRLDECKQAFAERHDLPDTDAAVDRQAAGTGRRPTWPAFRSTNCSTTCSGRPRRSTT